MNYAGKQKLPILFVVENNRYATFSDQLKRQASDNICERVRPFGVRATQVFGNDVVKVYDTLAAEVVALRDGNGPALVEAYTFRWNSHRRSGRRRREQLPIGGGDGVLEA